MAKWKVLAASSDYALHAMSRSGGKCVCTLPGGSTCRADAECVVEYENTGEMVQRAPCCASCRRACFGSTPAERAKAKKEAAERQTLGFDEAIVDHVNPQPWRR